MFSGAKINSTEVSGSSGLRFWVPTPGLFLPPLLGRLSSSPCVFTLPLKQCFCLMKVLKDFSSVGVVAELWGVSSLGLAAWTWRANWNSAWCLSREGHSSSLKGEICLRFAQTFSWRISTLILGWIRAASYIRGKKNRVTKALSLFGSRSD